MTRQSPALVSAEREADRLALAAARAEVAELKGAVARWSSAWTSRNADYGKAVDAMTMLRADLEDGNASDGHHTHRELYDYRMLYNAHAALGWLAAGIPVVKSWRHSDGEPCFGGGWFIVTADLPTGQVSNHYPEGDWDLFAVPAVDLAPTWDGHAPSDAARRLRAALDGQVQG